MKQLMAILLVMFLMLDCTSGYARLQVRAQVDSLLGELPQQQEDTAKVRLLVLLSDGYRQIAPDSGMKYVQQALDLAGRLNWQKGLALANHSLGVNYQFMPDRDKALACFQKTLKIYETVGDKQGIAIEHMSMGSLYKEQSNFPLALENHRIALKIFEELGDKKYIGMVCRNIGMVYRQQSNYPLALEYLLRGMKIGEERGDKCEIAAGHGGIATVYYCQKEYTQALDHYLAQLKIGEELGNKSVIANVTGNIGNVYMSSGNRTKALEYYLKALKASEEIGMKGYVVGACGNIANVYIEMKNFELGLEYYQRGLKISEEIHDKNSEATTLGNIGTTYIYMVMDSSKGRLPNEVTGARRVKLNKAIEYIQRSLKVCQETGDIDIRQACYQNLTNAYKLSGDYKKALESEEHERAIQDSVFSQENAKKIVEQGMKYQFEKKEALVKADQEKKDALAVKELQKQKLVRNGFMGGFAVVLLFAGIFFSQRNKIKIGKKQSDELLLNILPAEVAEELKAKGAAEARLIDDVTVLFTDFKGFTELSEKLTPKELVAEINDCFSAFDHIMHKYGVEKIKTIGDAYMAAGGLPTPNKTHPQDVVNAALEIQQYMNDHKLKKEAANQLFFEIRIGVHTGPVVAGIVGIKKFQYDIWGDTVNTASRMESSGAVGKVNISETTYALVKDKFKCAYRGKVSAKGKGEIDMYFVG